MSVGGAACVNVSVSNAAGTELNCTLTDAPPGEGTAVAIVDGVGLAAGGRGGAGHGRVVGTFGHGRHLRKLAIKRRPAVWLFWGWNWTPTRLSRPTAAVTFWP